MTTKPTFPKGAIGCPTGPMAWTCLPGLALGIVIFASLNRAKTGPWLLRVVAAILAFAEFAVTVPLLLAVETFLSENVARNLAKSWGYDECDEMWGAIFGGARSFLHDGSGDN